MVKTNYDAVRVYDVRSDVLTKRNIHSIDPVRADKLGIASDMIVEEPVMARNTAVIVAFSKLIMSPSENTLLMDIGKFYVPSIVVSNNTTPVFKVTPCVAISCTVVNILDGRQHDLLMYVKETNTILINKDMLNSASINTCLDMLIDYNIKNNIVNSSISINTLMLGTDPEFLLTEGDRLLPANNVLTSSTANSDDVGCDGRSSTGEFRPRPADNTPDLVKNMRALYKKLNTTIEKSGRKNVKVMTGGGAELSESLGGHIHFNIPPSTSLIRMLDDFIGRPLKNVAGAQRSVTEYGILGDHRHQPHGFEYRTPPSFIGKPDVFATTMAAARCVALTWIDMFNGKISEFNYCKTPSLENYLQLSQATKYKSLLTKFYNFTTNPSSTLYVPNTLAAWKIVPDKTESIKISKTSLHIVGNNDINIAEVARRLNTIGLTCSSKCGVYIYGISESRGIDSIIISRAEHTREPLAENVDYVDTSDMLDEYGFTPTNREAYDIMIGIPYAYRRTADDVAVTSNIVARELSNILA